MIHPNYLCGNGQELFLETLQSVGMTSSRVISNYQTKNSAHTKTLVKYIDPSSHNINGKILNDLNDAKRKLKYLQAVDDKVLMCLGSEQEAYLGNLRNLNANHASPQSLQVGFEFVTSGIAGHFWEAEDHNVDGVVATDLTASMSKVVQFDSIDEHVIASITQDDLVLPEGNYRMFARAKDLLQISNDLVLDVYNQTDDDGLAAGAHTLSSSYGLFTLDFLIDSNDVGDNIQLSVNKNSTTANTISLDFFGVVAL